MKTVHLYELICRGIPSFHLLNLLICFQVYSVRLEEGQGWTRLDPLGPRTASRADIMTVLANLESAQVLATPFTEINGTSLSDVALDTAVDHVTGEGIASWVEQCRCPAGYRGPSCEVNIKGVTPEGRNRHFFFFKNELCSDLSMG